MQALDSSFSAFPITQLMPGGYGSRYVRNEEAAYGAATARRLIHKSEPSMLSRMWTTNNKKGLPPRPATQPAGSSKAVPFPRYSQSYKESTYPCACARHAPARCSMSSASSVVSSLRDSVEMAKNQSTSSTPSLVVFSGGTAFNGIVEELKKLTTNVAHVLPVSDDGGSTAEIVRVLGGPAIGDIRSRCLRLSDESTAEALAVKRLLAHRLPYDDAEAKSEWHKIAEGEHGLWEDVSGPYRETIRAFLVYFHGQILMHSKEKFRFRNGSIGNFFFAGARIFFQSLDAAIFLFSRVSRISIDSLVLPAVCTNDRLTLGCELNNGTIIRGQNEISHPYDGSESTVDKERNSIRRLPSPIKRIFYMSSEGTNLLHEVFPQVNALILDRLRQANAVVYGMGSLYTSICPSLVLRGVGEVIAAQDCAKILLLNGTHDRETMDMSASDFINAISDALNRRFGDNELKNPATSYVNVVLVPEDADIHVDTKRLSALGITRVIIIDSIQDRKVGTIYEPESLIHGLKYAIESYQLADKEDVGGKKVNRSKFR